MANDRYLDEFPGADEDNSEDDSKPGRRTISGGGQTKENQLLLIMEKLSRSALGEKVLRYGTHLLSVTLVLIAIWGMRAFYLKAQQESASLPRRGVLAAALPSPTPTEIPPDLPAFTQIEYTLENGIPRLALLYTDIPTRPRTEVITYTVQKDDTIFGIAEKFNLKPETILWGNTFILGDNPHLLQPGLDLNILPTDGTYHRWSAGEGLNGVAKGYNVEPEAILDWPGNHLDPAAIGDYSNPNIEPGTFLMVPGGERAFVTWSAPRISRDNPGVAKLLGPGSCGTIMDGAVGIGTFVWPSNSHYVGGYNYSPGTNHFGIDLSGAMGDPIYAADNGVIVYAGWNNWGYGNVVVIDHGGGWQTLYAHLSYIGVGCGQSVYQGNAIGSYGSTGNSTGPHLHFEMLHETYGKVNPLNFLPPP